MISGPKFDFLSICSLLFRDYCEYIGLCGWNEGEIGMKTQNDAWIIAMRTGKKQGGNEWDRDITQNWNKLEITITVGEKVN